MPVRERYFLLNLPQQVEEPAAGTFRVAMTGRAHALTY